MCPWDRGIRIHMGMNSIRMITAIPIPMITRIPIYMTMNMIIRTAMGKSMPIIV